MGYIQNNYTISRQPPPGASSSLKRAIVIVNTSIAIVALAGVAGVMYLLINIHAMEMKLEQLESTVKTSYIGELFSRDFFNGEKKCK